MKLLIKYIKNTWNINKFIEKNFKKCNSVNKENKETICAVVQPWCGKPVPWVAIVLAMALKNNNNNVIILFNDIHNQKGTRSLILFEVEKMCIQYILRKISDRIQYVLLSAYKHNKKINLDRDMVSFHIEMNSIHYARGEGDSVKRKEFERDVRGKYNNIYLSAMKFFEEVKVDKFIIPGGIWGASGILRQVADLCGVKAMCYDGGDGSILFSTTSPSSQQKDIEIAFKEVLLTDESRDYAACKGREKLGERISGKDTKLVYICKDGSIPYKENDYYLILLNVPWDGAALGLHTIYNSMEEWILDTIKWVLYNTDKKIIIRQHPGERVKHVKSKDRHDNAIYRAFGNDNRIVFIDSESDVTAYELIKSSCCVVGFSSTAVVEAVALERPAIIVSKAYYSNLGIVYAARKKSEYYDFLASANIGTLKVNSSMKNNAYVCNYLTQTCNRLFTCFTTDEIESWVRADINELRAVGFIVEAIETSTPVSLLVHRKFLKESD